MQELQSITDTIFVYRFCGRQTEMWNNRVSSDDQNPKSKTLILCMYTQLQNEQIKKKCYGYNHFHITMIKETDIRCMKTNQDI